MAAAEAGYYQMLVPEDLGGGGEGAVTMYASWEAISRRCGPLLWLSHEVLTHWATGPSHVFRQVHPKMRADVLPRLMSGTETLCFAMSEPGAGSDVWMMSTRARADGEGWHLTGTKQWISNGPHADYALVFAVTDPERVRDRDGGISAFLVPTDAPGFGLDSVISIYGGIGGNHAILSLDEVTVGPEQLVGELDEGLEIGLGGISLGRMYNAARSVGYARWGLERALTYTRDRTTFGRPLIENQGVSFPLADSAMEIHAAHLMGLNCAYLLDDGRRALKEAAMAKAYATEMACRVLDRVMQAHGGMGITTEMGFTQAWQDIRTVRIADGSSEMLRRLIVRRLERGDLEL